MVVRPLRATARRLVREATALVAPIPEIVPAFARARTETRDLGRERGGLLPRAARRRGRARRSACRRARWRSCSAGASAPGTACTCSRTRRAGCGIAPTSSSCSRAATRAGEGDGYRGRRLGAVPYERDARRGRRLRHRRRALRHRAPARSCASGFFWSPLKIFEYMASGLPTVTVGPPSARRDRPRRRGGAAREGGGSRGARGRDRAAGRRRAAAPAAGRRTRGGAWSSATRGTSTARSSRRCCAGW